MLALLRPHPHRGDIVAAGVVVLTVFAVLVNARFADEWSDVVRLLVSLVIAAPVIAMAVQSDAGDPAPRPYEWVLHVCSFILLVLTLGNLASFFDGDGPGTVTWVGLLLIAYCAWFARVRNSAIMTLLGALTLAVVVQAAIDWVFEINSFNDVEWILLFTALAFTVAAVHQRDAHRRHAVSLVDAAGLTILFLGLIVMAEDLIDQFLVLFGGIFSQAAEGAGYHGGDAGWELLLLAFAFGLIAYGCVDRERAPVFIGVLVLSLFLIQAAFPGSGGPSLVGWPIVLLLLAGLLLAIGFRPRQELPPEPALPGAGPEPPAPAPTTPMAAVPPPQTDPDDDDPTLVHDR